MSHARLSSDNTRNAVDQINALFDILACEAGDEFAAMIAYGRGDHYATPPNLRDIPANAPGLNRGGKL